MRPKGPPIPAARLSLVMTLAHMPEEAFGYFVAWATGATMIYPEGLGSFSPESRISIDTLKAAAQAYRDQT